MVVPAVDEKPDHDRHDDLEPEHDERLRQARIAAGSEVQDGAGGREDLAERLEVADEVVETGEGLSRDRAARRRQGRGRRARAWPGAGRSTRRRRRASAWHSPPSARPGTGRAQSRAVLGASMRRIPAATPTMAASRMGMATKATDHFKRRVCRRAIGRGRRCFQRGPSSVVRVSEGAVEGRVDDGRADEAGHHRQERHVERAEPERLFGGSGR